MMSKSHLLSIRQRIFLANKVYFSVCAKNNKSYKLVVVGGGTGGCSTAAKYASKLGKGRVAIIDPADKHYYQPLFTLIGGGMKKLEESFRPMKEVLPKDADWIKESVVSFKPEENKVLTDNGKEISYDFLLIAMGFQLNYNKVKGLPEAFETPGVGSNYSPLYVTKTHKALKEFKGGNAVFTFPNCPIKCAGAPQKIMYIFEEYQRNYDFLHVTPPMNPPDVLRNEKKLVDEAGFLNLNKETLQHVTYPNIFGIGDCTNLPTSKTAAAVAGQVGIVGKNLSKAMDGKSLTAHYEGYTACPLVTGYSTCIMAEFDYTTNPMETFPFDQRKERKSMFLTKRDVLPFVYWNSMLRGKWEGPKTLRKVFHLGMK
ncbi:Sulfide:quinone oxidoreductase, mitochondrial [Armadillidium nasatum]|uniref:Sulfide:quinone oxidoreductase, mitochondrial n=1 Tax=Armadillidium nasatum TaxID=96803 RepID=A0A5N5T2Z2_9CRUS|nr:Sulfide:quinone oxidoreductase, mitochondrial [Armadillidium nasatum]